MNARIHRQSIAAYLASFPAASKPVHVVTGWHRWSVRQVSFAFTTKRAAWAASLRLLRAGYVVAHDL